MVNINDVTHKMQRHMLLFLWVFTYFTIAFVSYTSLLEHVGTQSSFNLNLLIKQSNCSNRSSLTYLHLSWSRWGMKKTDKQNRIWFWKQRLQEMEKRDKRRKERERLSIVKDWWIDKRKQTVRMLTVRLLHSVGWHLSKSHVRFQPLAPPHRSVKTLVLVGLLWLAEDRVSQQSKVKGKRCVFE